MPTYTTELQTFHPLIQHWFKRYVGCPTAIQTLAWPKIASGEHVLISAPTGSGKTLTAFLWSINQLLCKHWHSGHCRVLYVSPLKALNNDIQTNLITPLSQLESTFVDAGQEFRRIKVMVRSGDTPQSQRRRMLREPPEILITTPESLNILLASASGQRFLTGIKTVIMDEIHALIDTKRGVYMISAIDRLVALSGEFQRIALSATVKPMKVVAEFIGGYVKSNDADVAVFLPRKVLSIQSPQTKSYRVNVCYPDDITEKSAQESVWEPLARVFKRLIRRNRATLFFVNSRRLCETLTHLINTGEGIPLAYAHHGSLAKEIRLEVERRLKNGQLKAIIATNSLELGIDIGHLDEVILVQSPGSIASSIQKIGRAGHNVGDVSVAQIFATHPQDLIEAAVLIKGIQSQDIESVKPIQCPLDVLAQIIIAATAVQKWDIDQLYDQLRTSYVFHQLKRRQYDSVLSMLNGRYGQSRIRELGAKIMLDNIDNSVQSGRGALLDFYLSGGVIPDRGNFHLRHSKDNAHIGELDEEFVWEATLGQTMTFGTQNWTIQKITHNDVFVVDAPKGQMATPFWRSEENLRGFHFSNRILEFLQEANVKLEQGQFQDELMEDYSMQKLAAEKLIEFLTKQKKATGCDLPHRKHIIFEFVHAGPSGVPGGQLVIHTGWGGRINRPYAIALRAAWIERFSESIEVYSDNECVVLQLAHMIRVSELVSMVTTQNYASLLRKQLEGSGFFGARFRENAARALLITAKRFNQRMPLWMSRLRSQKLLDSIARYPDFPVLLETWRTCLQDEFDLEHLNSLLVELETGEINYSEIQSSLPSPMARKIAWGQISQYMYMDDASPGLKSNLNLDLIHEFVSNQGLRAAVSQHLADEFQQKRQRVFADYVPRTVQELLSWIKERVLVPEVEWNTILDVIDKRESIGVGDWIIPIESKLVRIQFNNNGAILIVAHERLDVVINSLYAPDSVQCSSLQGKKIIPPENVNENFTKNQQSKLELLEEWFRFYAPQTLETIGNTLGYDTKVLPLLVDELLDTGRWVTGQLIKDDSSTYFCDLENYESLLRLSRRRAVAQPRSLNCDDMILFFACRQLSPNSNMTIEAVFESLEGLFLPPQLWESDILPARIRDYDSGQLDRLVQEGELLWLGNFVKNTAFSFVDDLDLIATDDDQSSVLQDDKPWNVFFSDSLARYPFIGLLDRSGWTAAKLNEILWQGVWHSELTNDSMVTLRKGIMNGFNADKIGTADRRSADINSTGRSSRGQRRINRGSFSRWVGVHSFSGNWYRIKKQNTVQDPIDVAELNKDRVRLLLHRYGILFRELLAKELPQLRWSALFNSLRLMELSGELITGRFFTAIPGLQFMSQQAYNILTQKLDTQLIYWVNSMDPCSLCGVPLEQLKGKLPKRHSGTHLVYHGKELKILSRRLGRNLEIFYPSGDAHEADYLELFGHLLTRQFNPLSHISIELINGLPAGNSDYIIRWRDYFDVSVEPKCVYLYRKR